MVTSLNNTAPRTDIGYAVDQAIIKQITFSDTSPITIGGLPTGAVVTGGHIAVTTGFNAGSTAVLSVGYSDSVGSGASAYASAISVAAVAMHAFDELSTTAALPLSRPTNLIATLATTGSAATAGVAQVIVRFVAPNPMTI